MQQLECGLCGRRFTSDAEGAACPSCGVAAAHPVVAAPAPAPAPAIETASAAASMDAITADASGAREETTVAAQSTEAQFVEAETHAATEPPMSDGAPGRPAFADAAPADVSFVAPADALTQAATPIEPIEPQPEARPDESPTLPAETFAAMASAPEPTQSPAPVPPPDLAVTQQATPTPAPAEPTPPVVAQPFAAPTPPEQPVYTPTPERPAMPAGYPVTPTPPVAAPIPPNPYQPTQAPGAAYGYPPQPVPQPSAGYPPAQQPMMPVMQPPMQPMMQPPVGYPPAQPSQPLQSGMTMPMSPGAPGQQPPFAAPYGAPGGPPTYPGMMTPPPQPPQKRGNGKMVGIIAGVVAVALVLGFVGVLAMNKGASHGGSANATPTATPNASQILAKMQAFTYNDASFTMSLDFTSQGQSISGTGGGKITKNPNRSDIQFSFPLTESGTTYTIQFEVITDGSTSYTQISGIPGLSTNGKWIQSSSSSTSAGITPFDPGQLTNMGSLSNATLVGADTINGVPVYHLTATDTGSSGGTADIYVRQDNNQPVKISFTMTGSTSGSISIVFTSFNTGITISTPSPDQVTQG